MPDYDGQRFEPPAPVAKVTVRTLDRRRSLSDVAMLIDTGADVTLLPRACAETLGLTSIIDTGLLLEGFDGNASPANVVDAEVVFVGRNFHGHFALVEGECGILGRNVLNNLSLVFDGPHLSWREENPAP